MTCKWFLQKNATNLCSMISIIQVLNTRRIKDDGTFPIVFRITYQGSSRDLPTGISCKEIEWDSRKKLIKPLNSNLKVLIQRLDELRLKYQERILEYEKRLLDATSTVQQIREFLVGKTEVTQTLEEFWLQEIESQRKAHKYGNAQSYYSAYRGVKAIMNLNIQFKQVDIIWLNKLQQNLLNKGVKQTSVSVYMRSLRALYNKAIDFGLVEASMYPFRRFKIKTGTTSPRSLSLEELSKFFHADVDKKAPVFHYWNYAKLIFLLRGMNFTDLALLRRDNLKNGRLFYHRAKTKKLYSVELLPEVLSILEHYNDENRITLFPILSNNEFLNKSALPTLLAQYRKNCNKSLIKLGKSLNLSEKLTTYVFRYSHANACKSLGYSKDLISESLGHGYGLAVSSAYLENYNIELIDEMNKKVCMKVMGG
jgi:integrase/recombinase XerD